MCVLNSRWATQSEVGESGWGGLGGAGTDLEVGALTDGFCQVGLRYSCFGRLKHRFEARLNLSNVLY